jgi:tRNA (cytidine/uridine-2'-O-)-methyltransferase
VSIRVVLVNPLIPQNTGNIARLTAACSIELHLIEPLGFEISDRTVKRAGLDYWPEVKLFQHPSWEAFTESSLDENDRCWFFTKFAKRSYHDVSYRENDCLVFGSETKGLPESIRSKNIDNLVRIPIRNDKVRSFNLSNSVAIGVFEAQRQIGSLL